MFQNKLFKLTALLACIIGLIARAPTPSQAQSGNLLINGGFEGGYYNQDGIPEIAVPNGWKMHWVEGVPFTDSSGNTSAGNAHRPETVVWNKNDAPLWEQELLWRDGNFNVKLFKGGAPVYGGMSQDLRIEKGATYVFTVPIYADIVANYAPDGKEAPHQGDFGGVRLGVSRQGAAFRDAGAILYTGWFNNDNTPGFYLNMIDYNLRFTAPEDDVTLWVEMYGSQFLPNNGFFLDGLSLTKVGDAPTPTPPWPTNTPTPIWPTRTPTPRPTNTPIPTSTPTATPTNTPTATPTPTITPTPLPTGPWYTATPTQFWPTSTPVPTGTPLPEQDTAADDDTTQAVAAAPVAQTQGGGTPQGEADENGVIYATVGPGDSVWSIAAKNGLTLDEILELNNLSPNDVIFVSVGDRLIVGFAEPEPELVEEEAPAEVEESEASEEEAAVEEAPVAEEAEPEPEPVEVTPEPTATPAGAEICLKAYDDANQNSIHDGEEGLKADVAFTISNGESVVSNYISTMDTESFCVKNLAPGAYRVTRTKLPNETLTTGGEMAIALTDGASVEVVFGSFESEPVVEEAMEEEAAEVDTAVANNVAAATEDDSAESETTPTTAAAPSNPTTGVMLAVVGAAALLLVAVLIILLSRRKS